MNPPAGHQHHHGLGTGVGILVCVLSLGGCGTTRPSRFYALEPLPEAAQSVADTGGPSVNVGPVVISEGLDRPQMITRLGANELAIHEYDRWSEPLAGNVARVLTEDLSVLLGSQSIGTVPDSETHEPQLARHGQRAALRGRRRWKCNAHRALASLQARRGCSVHDAQVISRCAPARARWRRHRVGPERRPGRAGARHRGGVAGRLRLRSLAMHAAHAAHAAGPERSGDGQSGALIMTASRDRAGSGCGRRVGSATLRCRCACCATGLRARWSRRGSPHSPWYLPMPEFPTPPNGRSWTTG